jgi:hypothetical protein
MTVRMLSRGSCVGFSSSRKRFVSIFLLNNSCSTNNHCRLNDMGIGSLVPIVVVSLRFPRCLQMLFVLLAYLAMTSSHSNSIICSFGTSTNKIPNANL